MRFEDKVAVVTGAGQGIGEAYAKALAAEGAAIIVAELSADQGGRVADEIVATGGQAAFVATDVADPASTEAMAAAAVDAFGGIDLLVNNAAIYAGMRIDTLLTVPWDYYEKFMAVNLNGALLATRACVGSMRERGGGSIVNQSSTAAWMYAGYYGLAKHAINGLTTQLATELGSSDIRVNAIAPGPTNTQATRDVVPDEFMADMVAQLPLARLGQTDDLVGALLFLLSDEAAWVTGQILAVDGGQIVRF
jgi:NAD(P)-dependent dehydrogenase (short-subunit alcohol dehydrogenase family)